MKYIYLFQYIKKNICYYINKYLWQKKKNNGIVRSYHLDKYELKNKEYFMFNGKIEGEYKKFWINGKIRSIYNCKDNKLNGEYREYWENGQLNAICNYKNGKQEGYILVYEKLIFLDNLYID